ncbi:unnamed protein product [Boreogadus saida]
MTRNRVLMVPGWWVGGVCLVHPLVHLTKKAQCDGKEILEMPSQTSPAPRRGHAWPGTTRGNAVTLWHHQHVSGDTDTSPV